MKATVKSNLKSILDDRGISIRELSRMTELPFETLRRLYNDETKQYQRDTLAAVCVTLGIDISELLTLALSEDNE